MMLALNGVSELVASRERVSSNHGSHSGADVGRNAQHSGDDFARAIACKDVRYSTWQG